MNIIGKPPYKVPSMSEIEAIPWNGFKAASTFSGCGGSSLGYRMAGFRVEYANEFIDSARDSYRSNASPFTTLDGRDIREVSPEDILSAIRIKPGELDLFDGSPPCASFSTSGKRQSGWGQVKKYSEKTQRTDDLFFEFTRLLSGIRPKVFVAENVSGLIKGAAKGYFLEILQALKDCGYRVTCKVLDAQWLGVPQCRKRTIFIGVRDDLGIEPVHPKPMNYRYSVKDAWDGITENGPSFQQYKLFQRWKECEPSGNHLRLINLKRLRWNEPSNTVCQTWGNGTATITHPDLPVYPSILQLKRLCGFPDDFILKGTFAQQWERLGRAVPPVMMSHIASTIRDEILRKLP